MCREALQREREEDLRRQDDERRRRYRESQLKKEITERVAANDKSGDLKAYTQTKLKEYRLAAHGLSAKLFTTNYKLIECHISDMILIAIRAP